MVSIKYTQYTAENGKLLKKFIYKKMNLFKNASKLGGAQDEAIKNYNNKQSLMNVEDKQVSLNNKQSLSLIYMEHPKEGRAWGISNKENILKLLKTNNYLFEILNEPPFKMFFDIDKKPTIEEYEDEKENETFLNNCKNEILKIFNKAEFSISGNITDKKISYHIILNNYIIKNVEEYETFKNIIKSYLIIDGLDYGIYTKNRLFKMVNQSKTDGREQKIIYDENIKNHIIKDYFISPSYSINDILIKPEQKIILDGIKKKYFDLSEITKDSINYNELRHININNPKDILKLIKNNKKTSHQLNFIICCFCKNHNLNFNDFMEWRKQKENTEEDIKIWDKVWETADKYYKHINIHTLLKIFSLNYNQLLKEQTEYNFLNLHDYEREHDKKIIKINKFSYEYLNNDFKINILSLVMGAGKTYGTLNFLNNKLKNYEEEYKIYEEYKDFDEPPKENFLFISPSVALTKDIFKNINNFEYLKGKVETYDKKQPEGEAIIKNYQLNLINNSDNLIICLNSILKINEDRTYKYLILDEFETTLNKFFNNETFINKKTGEDLTLLILNKLISLINKAEKVIILDAFLSYKTLDFIRDLNLIDNTIIYKNNKEFIINNNKREFIKIDDFENILNIIINKLKENKKIFIFYPFKEARYNEEGEIKRHSVATLSELIIKNYNERFNENRIFNKFLITGDSEQKIKSQLNNVNKNWSDKDFIIYNDAITCGISYDVKNIFDCGFLILGKHNKSRDIIQASYRIRDLKENKIYYHLYKKSNDHREAININNICKGENFIYDNLKKNYECEYFNKTIKGFETFLKIGGYKAITNKGEIIEDYKIILDYTDENEFLKYEFDNINNIDRNTYKTYEERQIRGLLEPYESLEMKKYIFINSFKQHEEIKKYFDKLKILEESKKNKKLDFDEKQNKKLDFSRLYIENLGEKYIEDTEEDTEDPEELEYINLEEPENIEEIKNIWNYKNKLFYTVRKIKNNNEIIYNELEKPEIIESNYKLKEGQKIELLKNIISNKLGEHSTDAIILRTYLRLLFNKDYYIKQKDNKINTDKKAKEHNKFIINDELINNISFIMDNLREINITEGEAEFI